MALITRGKHKGAECRICQFCNDWFVVDLPDGKPLVMSPGSLKLTDQEAILVLEAAQRKETGILFGLFDLQMDGTFKRRKRAPSE